MVNPDIKTATLRLRLNPLTFVFLLCFTGKTDQNGSAVITVREDSDVVLPCSLATRENIEFKLFDWIKRATENDGQKEVFFYDMGIHYNNGRSGQSEEFKGRVSHFPEKLKHGDASIIIRNTKVTDSGNYTCVFPRLQPRQTFHTELVVERELRDRTTENILGPKVVIAQQDGEAILPCSLSTEENIELKLFDWTKTAPSDADRREVFFYDAGIHYNNGRPGQSDEFKGRVSHFPEELKHGNASIIIRNIKMTDSGEYTCVFPRLRPPQKYLIKLVVGPKVVIAQQDGEAVLPCSLSTEENIELKLFDWTKTAPSDADRREVFFYDAGIHYNNGRSGQSEQFKGRVSHFPEELKHGNASIIITNIKMTDSGEYTCHFPRLQPRQTFHIKLVVGAAPKPSVTILDETKDWSRLQCDVHGDPEPELEWRDSAGHKIPAGQQKASDRGGRQYFTLNATVTKTDSYHCVATQKTINHQTEAKIYVYIAEPPIINAYEGRDVSLPCSLDTKANIESELFEWRKDGQKEVFMFDGGKHSRNGHGSQSEEFKGRVFHFQDRLKHGDASITIINTKMTDRGNYTCEFPNLQPRQTFHMELVVVIGDGRSGPQSDGSGSTGWAAGVLGALLIIVVLLAAAYYIKLKR